MDNLDQILRYSLIPILVPILIPLVLNKNNKFAHKALVISLSIVVGTSVIPLYPLQGNNNNLISILDIIFKGHNIAFGVMLASYLLTIILLAIPGSKWDKLSPVSYLVGFIALWVGLFQPNDYENFSRIKSIIWVLLYILIPMANLILFFPLLMSEKSKTEASQYLRRKEIERSKIPFIKQLLPLLIMFIPLTIFVVGVTYFYDRFHCPNPETCKTWGTYFSKSSLFWLSGFFLFIVITLAIGKGVLKGEAKVARYLIPVVFILFLLGSYGGFQQYVKTNDYGIEGNNYLGSNHINIGWDQMRGYGIHISNSNKKCDIVNFYLVLEDNSKQDLSPIINDDKGFFEFLSKKNIKLLDPPQSCF